MPALLPLAGEAVGWLAQFGQSPSDTLPLAVPLLLGALFADPLASAFRRTPQGAVAALTLGLVLSGFTLLAAGLPLAFGSTPLVAATGALLLTRLRDRFAEALGASSVFIVATVMANYTLDAFLPLGDFFLVNVGTFFFGVTFTQRDRVHRFGRRWVYAMIGAAAVANVATAASLGTPLRFVAVSFLTILVAETADTEIFARLKGRPWFQRVLGSNAVSAPLDTVLFTVLAFVGAPFATFAWMTQVIVTDVLVKYSSGLLAALTILPGRAREQLRRFA
jgi:uncharacterized PurR-regulated membrane protein YhhQ (DUF165 family)